LASIDTKSNDLFIQKRIGQFGKAFNIYKLKSMKEIYGPGIKGNLNLILDSIYKNSMGFGLISKQEILL